MDLGMDARDVALAGKLEPLYGFACRPMIIASNSAVVNTHPSRIEISADWRPSAGKGKGKAEVEVEVRHAFAGVEAD
jgi:hypothetical protein